LAIVPRQISATIHQRSRDIRKAFILPVQPSGFARTITVQLRDVDIGQANHLRPSRPDWLTGEADARTAGAHWPDHACREDSYPMTAIVIRIMRAGSAIVFPIARFPGLKPSKNPEIGLSSVYHRCFIGSSSSR
jgi:hypothetical protein